MTNNTAAQNLPEIPVLRTVTTCRELFDMFRANADDMLDTCYKFYTKPVLAAADGKSRRWLHRTNQPYRDDVDYIAAAIGRKGIYTLNLSYEWACTTTAIDDTQNGGVKLWRALDWPIPGMADKVVVAKQTGKAGDFWNITYPGFAGMLQGMAENRFSIAINQAPQPKKWGFFPLDWLAARRGTFKSKAMPAPFLLRKVFEECATFDEAVDMLAKTPLCVPAIFTIAGTKPGEHRVIERLHNQAVVHKDNFCVSNHWLNGEWKATERAVYSKERQAHMAENAKQYNGDFDWLVFPVLNEETRLAFEANAKTGALKVRAMEADKIVTKTLVL
jgi:hypothetical protein